MRFIIVLIIIFVAVKWFLKKRDEKANEKVSNGDLDTLISRILYDFDTVRAHHSQFDTAIGILSHPVIVNGKPTGEVSKLLSIRVDDETGKNKELAEQLGMRITYLEEKNCYMYEIIEQHGLSASEKKAVVKRLASLIGEQYPDDLVMYKDGDMILSVGVGLRSAVDYIK